jgi:hypothetical protein
MRVFPFPAAAVAQMHLAARASCIFFEKKTSCNACKLSKQRTRLQEIDRMRLCLIVLAGSDSKSIPLRICVILPAQGLKDLPAQISTRNFEKKRLHV